MAWKKKRHENWKKKIKLNDNHILDLFISVPIRDMKRKLIRYQSVIIANIGFAPQILQKLWASENSPTHYLDSWVKVWVKIREYDLQTSGALEPEWPYIYLQKQFACTILL